MPDTTPLTDNRLRILIVDDDADHAEMLAYALDQAGLHTHAARNGGEAIALVDAQRPDCVLLDICMPGMDGLEVAQRLRASAGDDVVLIAMTGLDPKELRVQDTFSVVDHYFRKPFDMDALLRILKPGRP